MEKHSFNSSTIATQAATAETVEIPSHRIKRSKGIVALIINMVTVQFQHLTRIVVKVDGVEQLDLTPAQFRQYLQRFAKRFNAAVYPANADTSFSIPFYALEFDEGDPRRYLQQLRPGAVSVELSKSAVPGAGSVAVEWVYVEDPATAYLEIDRRNIGVANNQSREEKFFNAEGELKGYSINTVGLTEARLFCNRGTEEVPVWDPMLEGTGAGVIEEQRLDDGSAATDPIARKVFKPVPCKLRLLLTTAAGWAGAGNELVMYRLIRVA